MHLLGKWANVCNRVGIIEERFDTICKIEENIKAIKCNMWKLVYLWL